MAIDWALIEEFEGEGRLDGYVPDPEGSQSGVTIATGVDLGARSESDLHRLDIPDALRRKLAPYTGHKKQAAVAFLADNPLTLTEEETAALDNAIRNGEIEKLSAAYNASVGMGAFDDLPDPAQTIIASVAFQYGNLPRRAPTFWRHATARNWEAMIAELEDFGDKYPTRRHKEAEYLREGLA